MAEVTEEESKQQVQPESAVGKFEPDPTNPEIKTAKFSLDFIVTSDGTVFIDSDRPSAIQHEEALRDRRKSE